VLTSQVVLEFPFFHLLKDGSKEDSSYGYIYRADSAFYIRVTRPLNQSIYFAGDTMFVVYPDSQLAFKIKSGVTFQYQAQAFMPKRGEFLKRSGFIFIKRENKNTLVYETWGHPKENVRVTYVLKEGKVYGMSLLSPKGDTLFSVNYGDFTSFEGAEFPLYLHIKAGAMEEVYQLEKPRRVEFGEIYKKYFKIGENYKVTLSGF